jgi:hypothetical protein
MDAFASGYNLEEIKQVWTTLKPNLDKSYTASS